MQKIFLITVGAFLISAQPLFGGTIVVFEEGVSDTKRDGEQRDYQEAVMNAKLKAIEKAGVSIKSITEIVNFQLKNDWVESRAEGVLLSGFRIKKIGYGEDGAYHVVLLGKIRTISKSESSSEQNGIIIVHLNGTQWTRGLMGLSLYYKENEFTKNERRF